MIEVSTQISRDLWGPRRRKVVKFAASAVRVDADCIGWLPYEFYDEMDEAGRLLSVTRAGDLVGFCAWGLNWILLEALVVQIWVRKDARYIEHGRALVTRLEQLLEAQGIRRVRLWCADDLHANIFWPQVGFEHVSTRCGRGLHRIRRNHNLWIRSFDHGKQKSSGQTAAVASFAAMDEGSQYQKGADSPGESRQRLLFSGCD